MDDVTSMESVTMISFNATKSYLLLPILSILTIFLLPLNLYWNPKNHAKWCYSEVNSIVDATHLLVLGKSGYYEIIEIKNL